MHLSIIYQIWFLRNKKEVNFKKKEFYFTEKFALLNLLTALGKMTAQNNGQEEAPSPPQKAPQSPPPTPYEEQNNMLASVLARHETISNRVKNKK